MNTTEEPSLTQLNAVTEPLDILAAQINARLDKADKADETAKLATTRAMDFRISAGLILIAARKRVTAEGGGWEAWCQTNIKRSQGEIRKLMKLAGSDDPAAAREAEKQQNRQAKARFRRAQAERADINSVSAVVEEPTEDLSERAGCVVSWIGSGKLDLTMCETLWALTEDERAAVRREVAL